MSRSSEHICRKCFPNGCCGFCQPPPQIVVKKETVINVEKAVEKKDLQYGGVKFYPGVRTSDNQHTSPMLSIHLYQHSQHKANTGQDQRSITVQGTEAAYTHHGARNLTALDRANAVEEILMIPVEDIVAVGCKLEVTKGLQVNMQATTTPTYEFRKNRFDDCWNSVKNCCRNTCGCCQEPVKVAPLVLDTTIVLNDPDRNTTTEERDLPLPQTNESCTDCCRCWCCKKRVLTRLLQKMYRKDQRDAQRVITMTIQYSKYSNLNTPSHTRLLSGEHQAAYYKEKFDAEKQLKFYLVHDTEFDPANFELKKAEAEALCRTIMQLKGMKGHYPSANELEQLLGLAYKKKFGDLYTEPTLHIPVTLALPPSTQPAHSTQSALPGTQPLPIEEASKD